MKRAIINLGAACNNACLVCRDHAGRAAFGPQAIRPYLQKIQETLSRAAAQDVDEVVFTGGEPTLHPQFGAAVSYAKSLGLKAIRLQTNARVFCYPEHVQAALRAGVSEFEITLLGTTAACHEYLTGTPGSFLQTLAGAKSLAARGARLTGAAVLARPNYRHLPDLARLWARLGAKALRLYFPQTSRQALPSADGSPIRSRDGFDAAPSADGSPIRSGDGFDAVVPHADLAFPYAAKAVDLAESAGLKAILCGFEPRSIPGYEDRAEPDAPQPLALDNVPVPLYPCGWTASAASKPSPEASPDAYANA